MKKRSIISLSVILVLLLVVTTTVSADRKTNPGLEAPPPGVYNPIPECGSTTATDTPIDLVPVDDSYDGTQGSMACSTINISDMGQAVTTLTVDVALTHTWAGDVTIKIFSPAGNDLTLMNRPGFAGGSDDGSGCCGDSSNFGDGAGTPTVITFDDAAADSAELLGDAQPGSDDIIPDSTVFPDPDGATGFTSLADFIGEDPMGDWMICFGDSAGGDFGSVDGVTLNMGCDMTAVEMSDVGISTFSPVALITTLVVSLAGMTAVTLRHRRDIG